MVGRAAQGYSASKGHQAAAAQSRWATLPLPSGDMGQGVWLSGTDFQSYLFFFFFFITIQTAVWLLSPTKANFHLSPLVMISGLNPNHLHSL